LGLVIGQRQFNPSDINGLVGWYDASDANTINIDSGNITQWEDKSDNGYHLTNGNGGQQPSYVTAGINGLNVVWYENTYDQMFNDTMSVDCPNCVGIFSVGMAKTAGDYPAFGYIRSTDSSDTLEARLQCTPSNGRVSATCKLNGTSYSIATAYNAIMAEEVPILYAVGYDATQICTRINGGTIYNTTEAPDGLTFTINRIQCGRQSNTPKNYQGEYIVVENIDAEIIAKIEGYLARKWGLIDKLPVTHPYKTEIPAYP
jgi:hypothetical protein